METIALLAPIYIFFNMDREDCECTSKAIFLKESRYLEKNEIKQGSVSCHKYETHFHFFRELSIFFTYFVTAFFITDFLDFKSVH
jgi:hypothetical protein